MLWTGARSPRLHAPLTFDGPKNAVRITLAVLLPLALLLGWFGLHHQGPRTLSDARLVGARGPVCLRLVIAEDISGSMANFGTPRSAAVSEFLSWAPSNLRGNDEIGVLHFAGSAAWTRRPARVASPSSAATGGGRIDPSGSEISPVLRLVGALPSSRCDTELLMLSDGQLSDLPAGDGPGRSALAHANVHDVSLLVPGKGIRVPGAWSTAFAAAHPQTFDGTDADQTAVTFARTISDITGQRLERT